MTHSRQECPSSPHPTLNTGRRSTKQYLRTLKTICLGLLLGAVACQQSKENAFAGKSGVAVEYYSNTTNVRARYDTKEGVKNGLFESYYPSGRVKSEAHYQEGFRVGKVIQYHEDGRVQAVDYYEKLEGDRSVRTTYYDSTQVVKIRVQLKDGVAEGLTQLYYPNGKLKSETVYHHGYRQGPSTQYYEDGKVRARLFYKGDRQDSISRTYFPNGQLNIESTYYAGKLHGPYKLYSPDGKLQKQLNYQAGQPIK